MIDREILKRILEKSASLQQAEDFIARYAAEARPPLTTRLEPKKVSAAFTPKPEGLAYRKVSTQPDAPERAGKRWDIHETARLARLCIEHSTVGKLNYNKIADVMQRSPAGIYAMSLNLLYVQERIQFRLSKKTLEIIMNARGLPEYPKEKIPDFRDPKMKRKGKS